MQFDLYHKSFEIVPYITLVDCFSLIYDVRLRKVVIVNLHNTEKFVISEINVTVFLESFTEIDLEISFYLSIFFLRVESQLIEKLKTLFVKLVDIPKIANTT